MLRQEHHIHPTEIGMATLTTQNRANCLQGGMPPPYHTNRDIEKRPDAKLKLVKRRSATRDLPHAKCHQLTVSRNLAFSQVWLYNLLIGRYQRLFSHYRVAGCPPGSKSTPACMHLIMYGWSLVQFIPRRTRATHNTTSI